MKVYDIDLGYVQNDYLLVILLCVIIFSVMRESIAPYYVNYY